MQPTPSLPLVILSHKLPAEWLKALSGSCRLVEGPLDATHLDDALLPHLPNAAGILVLLTIPVTEALLAQMPQLKVVSNMAVGVDNVNVPACTRRGIPVGNTPGVLTEATADLTMALLLAAARKIPQSSQDAREGMWTTWSPTGWLGADLSGATLGIIGLGKIGKAVARRALGFGMQIVYTDSQEWLDAGAQRLPLEDLLQQSDIVSLHAPLNSETRALINAHTLGLMKPTALLINAARGPIVDSQALYAALRDGVIAGAALDVTDPEPLPPDHPLYSLPNCLVVPHIGSATRNTRRMMAELACANILAGLQGKQLPHCVNPEVYS